jgi:hypothetical protein
MLLLAIFSISTFAESSSMELSIKEILQIEQEAIDEAAQLLNSEQGTRCFSRNPQIISKIINIFSSEFGYRTYMINSEAKGEGTYSIYYMGPLGTLRSDADDIPSDIIWTFVIVFLVLGFMAYTWYGKQRSEKYSEERLN